MSLLVFDLLVFDDDGANDQSKHKHSPCRWGRVGVCSRSSFQNPFQSCL